MRFLDVLLPLRCAACGAAGTELCADCRARLPRIGLPICARCGAPTAWPVARCRECAGRCLAFAQARSALAYSGPVPRVVTAWKERGLRHLAREVAAIVAEAVPRPCVKALVCVPAQDERALRRGFHPAEALAFELAAVWELPLEPLLERVGVPRRQRGLKVADRRRNVGHAFRARAGIHAPAIVCLVDDVYTTGETASACSSMLLRAGCRRVEVIALARAVRER